MSRKTPVTPVVLFEDETMAIRRVFDGVASAREQRLAMEAIIKKVSDADAITFYPGPDGDRLSAFAEGRRYVGMNLKVICTGKIPSKAKHATPSPETA